MDRTVQTERPTAGALRIRSNAHPKRRPTLFLMRFLTCFASVNQSKQTKTPKHSYHVTAPHNPPEGVFVPLFCHYIVINVSLHLFKYRNSNTHGKHTPAVLHTVKRSDKEANKGFRISLFPGIKTLKMFTWTIPSDPFPLTLNKALF